jgi:hypothetical protein
MLGADLECESIGRRIGCLSGHLAVCQRTPDLIQGPLDSPASNLARVDIDQARLFRSEFSLRACESSRVSPRGTLSFPRSCISGAGVEWLSNWQPRATKD